MTGRSMPAITKMLRNTRLTTGWLAVACAATAAALEAVTTGWRALAGGRVTALQLAAFGLPVVAAALGVWSVWAQQRR